MYGFAPQQRVWTGPQVPLITSFSTSFLGTENPLSESGAWITGINSGRTVARKEPGDACGTMVSFDGTNFTDSVAMLANWSGNNQSVQATLLNNSAPAGLETELVLRCNGAGSTGYEIDLFLGGGEVNMVRWNGPNNDFTIANAGSGNPFSTNASFADGAVWFGSISGNLINVTCNGLAVVTNLDITTAFNGGLVISSGSPGIGFWNETGVAGNQNKFGWKNFTANAI